MFPGALSRPVRNARCIRRGSWFPITRLAISAAIGLLGILVTAPMAMASTGDSIAPPTVTSFSATPTTVTAGSSVTLQWEVVSPAGLSLTAATVYLPSAGPIPNAGTIENCTYPVQPLSGTTSMGSIKRSAQSTRPHQTAPIPCGSGRTTTSGTCSVSSSATSP